MLKKSKCGQKGFTLVEIAIVLVIVGLLIGGVLKGQEMIKAGKVKKATKQMEDLVAAINTYQDKVGKLPGSSTAAAAAGNDALLDLNNQKFIASTTMTNPYGGSVTAVLNTTTNKITITNNALPDYVAYSIDRSLDDGVGTTGSMTVGAAYATTEAADDETARNLVNIY